MTHEQAMADDFQVPKHVRLPNDPQPTPQDISKWIEDEAQKEEIYEPKYGGKDHSGYDTMMKYEINYERSECFEKGAKAMYQLLLPELQQIREWKRQAIEIMPDMQAIGKALGVKLGETIHDKILSGIEQQKSQIDELKRNVFGILAERESLKLDNKRQAAEIESLKKELGKLHSDLLASVRESAEIIELAKADAHKKNLEIESLKQENAKATQLLERIFLSAPEPLASEIYSFIRSKRSISNASQ